MGPLVDHRLIWWDAVIPRGKATNTRTPICIILYCRPDLLGTIAKYFESQRLYLKTPPFYNPACRYSNPHHHILEQQYQLQQQQIQQQQQQQQKQRYSAYEAYQQNYGDQNPYNATTHRYNYAGVPRDERQGQKEIEILLSSIPSDVPLIKRKKKRAPKRLIQDRGVIEIDSNDEMDELDEDEEDAMSEDGLEEGHVDGLACTLMEHQIKGVSWMIDRENNESSNGGILADDMGLGKTIQTIALMVSTMTSEDHRMTLIVTPLALVHQWVDEIRTKTDKSTLRVLKHHGPNRTKNPAVLRQYDVVVTTYQVVASDMPPSQDKKRKKKKGEDLDRFLVLDEEDDQETQKQFPSKYTPLKKDHGPLFQIDWHRVVLDEAQFIKNRTTKASISCATLSSAKRWCLTGTPIQNNVDELYSLLRFLRIQPLSEYATFKKTISIPIMNGDTQIAMSRLKAVLMAVMLRRTKAVLNSNQQEENDTATTPTSESTLDESVSKKLTLCLPTRQKQDITLEFSMHERKLYQLLMTKTQDSIQSMVGNQSRYMNMLCMLLRLRQGKAMLTVSLFHPLYSHSLYSM